ncbi:MAG: 6-phosphogluconolactonase [Desulfovibrionaceae bacterium]
MPDIRIYPTFGNASSAAAASIAEAIFHACEARGMCTLVLSGGGTPKRLHTLLAANPAIDWPLVHLFFGDERCVGPSDEYANFRMVRETLCSVVRVPASNIHRIPGELGAQQGAATYERELSRFFGPIAGPPRFDCLVLGMGADGHTASLFPGAPGLKDTQRWVTPVLGPTASPPVDRISLTLPVINNARQVFFLVTGKEKAAALRTVLEPDDAAAPPLPAALVRPDPPAIWFVDNAAAHLLHQG